LVHWFDWCDVVDFFELNLMHEIDI
jgi:hypothetical protein